MRTICQRAALHAAIWSLGGLATAAHAALPPPEIIVNSNRADMISGGDALVEIKWPAGVNPAMAKIALNGTLINSSFALRPNGKYMGLVTGLREGSNVLTARVPGAGAQITITNYSLGGPIFSGPQVQPWICQTTNAPSMGPALDEKCTVASPVYRYRYRTTAGAFANYDPNAGRPANMATTTTDQGVTVDYIIRIERGSTNRGTHEIAVLYDPTKPWAPWAPQSAWNGKLFIPFGSGCEYTFNQGNPGSVEYDVGLSRGFMVMSSSNTQYSVHCNDVVAAETVMMLKERITEAYGPIRYTMSNGVSGGSHLQNLLNTAYPGLLQGSIPGQNFEDTWTVYREFSDCGLLARLYAAGGIGAAYTEAQKAAIDGHANSSTCAGPINTYMASRTTAYIGPSDCAANLPAPGAYNPTTNVNGTRCTQQDYQVAVFGKRDSDGFARRPLDSVGVQYGLVALNSGAITPQMFVDVNVNIGCWNIDQVWTPGRCTADPGAVEIAHATGRVATGLNHAKVAMIESRDNDYTEEHFTYRSIVSRNRLIRDTGTAASRAIWRIYTTASNVGGSAATQALPFDTVNQWLAAVEADTSNKPLEQKILDNRPPLAVDRCVNSNGTGRPDADCDAAFVVRTNVRVAAGEVETSDVMKCQLKPMSRLDYNATFTDTQWAALSAVFPGGVCDYSKPGVGQVQPTPWLTFANGPGGQPAGPAPVSQPLP